MATARPIARVASPETNGQTDGQTTVHLRTGDHQFKIISDEYRVETGESTWEPVLEQLKAGKTVFLPGLTKSNVGSMYDKANATKQYKAHVAHRVVDEEEGIAIWWTRIHE